jgi:prevent-host-death family protein
MRKIGVRALQQNAASVLRAIRRGGRVEVTDRGRPIARLVPATGVDVLDLLEDAGILQRAEGDLLDLGEPLTLAKGRELASRRLSRMRAHER